MLTVLKVNKILFVTVAWCPFLLGQELRALGTDQVDSFGKRRHNTVGLRVGTRNALGHQDATQNVWSGEHRRSVQTSKEERCGVMGFSLGFSLSFSPEKTQHLLLRRLGCHVLKVGGLDVRSSSSPVLFGTLIKLYLLTNLAMQAGAVNIRRARSVSTVVRGSAIRDPVYGVRVYGEC